MIKENHEKGSDLRKSKFLERFEGKTSAIGKAGLLSLLEQNLPQSKFKPDFMANYLESGLIEPRQRNPELSARFRRNSLTNDQDIRSSNHSFKTELPRKCSLQLGSLGSLAGCTNTTNTNSIPKLPRISKPNLGFNMRSSVQLKPERKISFQALKKDTAQHLQFLNLFEQRLKRVNK